MTNPLQSSHINAMVEEIEGLAILLLDIYGNVVNWNKGAQKIKGYKAEEIIGKNFSVFYLEVDKASGLPQYLLRQAAQNGKAEHTGWRVKKDGNTFWGSILITALHDAGGDVIGYTKVTRDLTAHKLLEESRQAYLAGLEQRTREMEQLTYIASHDLQEPLRTIQGVINILREKEEIANNEDSDMMMGFIGQSVERMQKLIKGILEYSLLGADKEAGEVDCKRLVSEILEDISSTIQLSGAIVECGEMPTVRGYAIELRQLFQNLITNALKFRREGVAPYIAIRAEKGESGKWRFLVSDNGIGIAPQHFIRIFRLFQRLHLPEEYAGTGLGLAYAKKIAELHNGTIDVASEPGQGSVFSFTIGNCS